MAGHGGVAWLAARSVSSNAESAQRSCSRYMALRWVSTSKSTLWASNSGPSTQAKRLSSPTATRQPPHIPVPSTMIELRLTMVLTPRGRVASATARIIGTGPIASTKSMRCPLCSNSASLAVTKPFSP